MGLIFEAVRPSYKTFVETIDPVQLGDKLAGDLTSQDMAKIRLETRNHGNESGMRLLISQVEGKIYPPTLLKAVWEMGYMDLVIRIFDNYLQKKPRTSLPPREQPVFDEMCAIIERERQTATTQHSAVAEQRERQSNDEHQAARNSPTNVSIEINVQIGQNKEQSIDRVDSGLYSDDPDSAEGDYEVVVEPSIPSSDLLRSDNSSHQDEPASRLASSNFQYFPAHPDARSPPEIALSPSCCEGSSPREMTMSSSRPDENSPDIPMSPSCCEGSTPGEMIMSSSRPDESSPLEMASSLSRCDGNSPREIPVSMSRRDERNLQETPASDYQAVQSLGVRLRETSSISHPDETEPKEVETGRDVVHLQYHQQLSATPSVDQCQPKNSDKELEQATKMSKKDPHETSVKLLDLDEQDSIQQDFSLDESHLGCRAEFNENWCISSNVNMAPLNTTAAESSVLDEADDRNSNPLAASNCNGHVVSPNDIDCNNIDNCSYVHGDHQKTELSHATEPTTWEVNAAASENRQSYSVRQVIRVSLHLAAQCYIACMRA